MRKLTPDKNEYSHVMDALQYLCLAAHGGMAATFAIRLGRRPRSTRPKVRAGAWT